MTKREEQPRSSSATTRWLLMLGIAAVVAFFVIRAPTDPPLDRGDGGGDGGLAGAVTAEPRCTVLGPAEGYPIGEARRPPSADAGTDGDLDRFAPFAPEIGRGAAVKAGFAVGIKRDREGASAAAVALLDRDGKGGRLVELGPARGDMDAPTLRAKGDHWVAALLEPNASGLSLRLVHEVEGKPAWGAEIEQGRDESLAYDLAMGGEAGVVTWDDVTEDGDRGLVLLATVSPKTLKLVQASKVVSSDAVDGEMPRLVARPGGFWLAYVARKPAAEPKETKGGKDEPPAKVPAEGRFAAERIEPSWLELLPLDEAGKPTAEPRSVTSREGHVLAFDLELGTGGAALLTWRDDDTPSGAHGGRVTALLVGAAGGTQEQLVAEDDVGSGVPDLLAGWVALPDVRGRMRLAPISADGLLLGELRAEPLLGGGEVIAVAGDHLLMARPAGGGVDLVVLRCVAGPPVVDGGG